METPTKPLGHKSYGGIPHLLGSLMGDGDRGCDPGQMRICTEKARPGDRIVVTEKLDGSNVAVARVGDEIVAINRAGYRCIDSPFSQHRLFHAWVAERADAFRGALKPGERIAGEWLAQAHGILYRLPRGPFVAFDLIRGRHERAPFADLCTVAGEAGVPSAAYLHDGDPISVEEVVRRLRTHGHHGAVEAAEGVVYRVERRDGTVDFLAKWVRPDMRPGCYLPCETNGPPVWNWPAAEWPVECRWMAYREIERAAA